MIRLLALLLLAGCAVAQTPDEYLQICPTPDCIARDAARSITATTGMPHETAVGGYIRGLHPGSNAVGVFSLATRETAGGSWAINTLMQDAAERARHFESGRLLVGWEVDFNVMGPSDVIGISLGGNSLSQPASANAFVVNSLGGGAVWDTSLFSMDGVARNALFVGSTQDNPAQSQRVMFRSGPYLQILQADAGVMRLYSTGTNGFRVEYGAVQADRFVPNTPVRLSDSATPAQIVRALKTLGLVQ